MSTPQVFIELPKTGTRSLLAANSSAMVAKPEIKTREASIVENATFWLPATAVSEEPEGSDKLVDKTSSCKINMQFGAKTLGHYHDCRPRVRVGAQRSIIDVHAVSVDLFCHRA